ARLTTHKAEQVGELLRGLGLRLIWFKVCRLDVRPLTDAGTCERVYVEFATGRRRNRRDTSEFDLHS
ncbi:hypothetical protein NEUTE1DRAFT_118171, partial [Neurospora tetrasperma FGSC 2508]